MGMAVLACAPVHPLCYSILTNLRAMDLPFELILTM